MKKMATILSIGLVLLLCFFLGGVQAEDEILIRNIDKDFRQNTYIYVLRLYAVNDKITDIVMEVEYRKDGKIKKEIVELDFIGGASVDLIKDAFLETRDEIKAIKIVKMTGKVNGKLKDLTPYLKVQEFKPLKITIKGK